MQAKHTIEYFSTDDFYKIQNGQEWYISAPVQLPIKVSFYAYAEQANSEIIPIFSQNKLKWGNKDADGLTFYGAPHRNDFGFRTGVFKDFPQEIGGDKFALTFGDMHFFEVEISQNYAQYSVNGKLFSKVILKQGDVQKDGYFGFITYNTSYFVKDLKIQYQS